MFAKAIGSRTFQPNSMSLSARKRGNVDRNQIKTNMTKLNFKENQTAPGIKSKKRTGFQPPKNRTVVNAAIANIYTYSASIKNAQRNPEYSIWKPATISDSASGKSNGTRLSSATDAMKKTIKAIGCAKINQTLSCASTISKRFKLPDSKITPMTD